MTLVSVNFFLTKIRVPNVEYFYFWWSCKKNKKKIVHWMDSILYNGVFIKVSLFIVHESSILR